MNRSLPHLQDRGHAIYTDRHVPDDNRGSNEVRTSVPATSSVQQIQSYGSSRGRAGDTEVRTTPPRLHDVEGGGHIPQRRAGNDQDPKAPRRAPPPNGRHSATPDLLNQTDAPVVWNQSFGFGGGNGFSASTTPAQKEYTNAYLNLIDSLTSEAAQMARDTGRADSRDEHAMDIDEDDDDGLDHDKVVRQRTASLQLPTPAARNELGRASMPVLPQPVPANPSSTQPHALAGAQARPARKIAPLRKRSVLPGSGNGQTQAPNAPASTSQPHPHATPQLQNSPSGSQSVPSQTTSNDRGPTQHSESVGAQRQARGQPETEAGEAGAPSAGRQNKAGGQSSGAQGPTPPRERQDGSGRSSGGPSSLGSSAPPSTPSSGGGSDEEQQQPPHGSTTGSNEPPEPDDPGPDTEGSSRRDWIDLQVWRLYRLRDAGQRSYKQAPGKTESFENKLERSDLINTIRSIIAPQRIVEICPDQKVKTDLQNVKDDDLSTAFLERIRYGIAKTADDRERKSDAGQERRKRERDGLLDKREEAKNEVKQANQEVANAEAALVDARKNRDAKEKALDEAEKVFRDWVRRDDELNVK